MRTLVSLLRAFFRNRSVKVFIAALCFVAVFFLGGLTVYKVAVDPIKMFHTPQPSQTPLPTTVPLSYVTVPHLSKAPQHTQSMNLSDSPLSISEGMVNILLIGTDYSPERASWSKNFNADVMMILAVDFDNHTVDMISVPRDTFAPIYDTPGIYKLNAALHLGGGMEGNGIGYVIKSVENVMGGISIPYYMAVNMQAVKSLVDAVGGVDYQVDVEIKMQGRTIALGHQHLTGQDVLDYLRARKGIDNDIGRVGRQKKMLIAIFSKLQQTRLIYEVPSIIRALKDDVSTNLSFEQFSALAIFGKNLDTKNIAMHTVKGHFLQLFNRNIYILDEQARIQLIEDVYKFTPQPMSEASQKYAKLTWATIQAEGCIDIVLNTFTRDTGKRISKTSRMWLQKKMDMVQNAVTQGDRYVIDTQTEGLKAMANAYFASAGIKVNWYINENPDQEIMTG